MANVHTHRRVSIAFAALCLFGATSARAVTLDVHWGFGGVHRGGRWTPVTVVVDNTSHSPGETTARAVAGKVIVSSVAFDGRAVAVEKFISVPANARKRTTLTIKALGVNPVVNVRLVYGGTTIKKDVRATPAPDPQGLVAVLSDDALSVVAPATDRPTPARLISPDHAPDRWIGYDGADAVVIPAYTAAMLDQRQLDALDEWVRAGGRLIILTGRAAVSFRNCAIESWLPATVTDQTEIDASLLDIGKSNTEAKQATIVLANLSMTPDGLPVWQRDGRLLAARTKRGLGTVDVWAFDLSGDTSVVRSRTGVQALWATLPGNSEIADRNRDFFETFTTGFDFGMEVGKPNVMLIGLGLLAYFIVVGPLNFFLLKKFGKQEWGWLTVPAVVVVFTVALYAIAVSTRGGEMVARSFSVVHSRAGAATARLASIGGVFTPSPGTYPINFSVDDAALLPLTTWHDPELPGGGLARPLVGGGGAANALMGVNTLEPVEFGDDGMNYPRLSIPQWTLRYFTGDALLDLGGAVDAKLSREGDRVIGEVTNATALHLDDAAVLIGDSLTRLGDLSPGEAKSVDIDVARDVPLIYSWGAAIAGRHRGVDEEESRDLEERVRRMFGHAVLNRWPIGPAPRRGETPYLVAWPRDTMTTLQVGSRAARQSDHAVFICELPMSVGASGALLGSSQGGYLSVSRPTLEDISAQDVEFYAPTPSETATKEGANPQLIITKGGHATISLIPPISPLDGKLTAAQLAIAYTDPDNESQKLQAYIKNYATGGYELLETAPGEAQWLPLTVAEHVNPFDGRVTVRFSAIDNPDKNILAFGRPSRLSLYAAAYRFSRD